MKSTALLALSATVLVATGAEEIDRHRLRILTLGNRAPFIQEVRDGARYEVAPPEGSLPPREITVGISGEENAAVADGEPETLRLRLGEVAGPVEVPSAGDPEFEVTLRDPDSGKPWLEPKLHPGGDTLLVVWRIGRTWDETSSMPVDDSAAAVPPDTCRIVNVAPVELGVIWGGQRLRLSPGKMVNLKFPDANRSESLSILHPDGAGGVTTALSTVVPREAPVRRQWFVYKADRPDARRPIQVLPLIEPR